MKLTLLLIAMLPSAALAQLSGAQRTQIDQVFANFDKPSSPGCVLGIGQSGKPIYEHAYGMANLEYDAPLAPGSIMEIGSVSKQFTAASILLLAERGVLSLDDDVRRWIPELPDFGRKITLRMMAHHSSGLRDQWGLLALKNSPPGSAVHDLNLIVDLAAHQRDLNFAPNDQYLYSNTGFALLAVVVQRASGKSLAEFSHENIFQPLGMTHTQWRDDYTRVVKGRSTAYSGGPNGTFTQEMPFTNVYGNGGLLTTVGDLIVWWDALLQHRLGSANFTKELTTPNVFNSGKTHSYALGVSNGTFRGLRTYTHSGATAGYRAYLVAYPDQNMVIATLCNTASANPTTLSNRVAEIVLADKLAPAVALETKSSGIPATDLAGLAGLYRDTNTTEAFHLDVNGERLMRGPFTLSNAQVTRNGNRITVSYPDEDVGTVVLEKIDSVTNVKLDDYTGTYRSNELDVSYDFVIDNGKLVVKRRLMGSITIVPTYADAFTGGGTWLFTRDSKGRVNSVLYTQGRVRRVRFDRV